MTEETIFAEALEKSTPSDRTAYLEQACAGDIVLRQRIETLLKSHESGGNFLGKPAIQCAAEELAGQACVADTQGEVPADDEGVEALDFLDPSDKPGALGRLGHYEILEVIGRGGMGVVLRAVDEKLQRVVAIKVMAAQLATNATARRRFTREAQAAAAVTHDHLVTIHAVEESNGLPYLVMQYVSGMSLQERLNRRGALELREIVRIGMQTAAGLAAAHAHGLIHRDIKPANILLENGVERVKITDFGLARAVADASLTQSGAVAGTPQYMSPEQARGEAVDQRTDLFSLGSVLYAMCAGRPPFRAESGMAVLKRVCDDIPSAIRETNAEIPDWLVAIVTKLHAKNSADRFQSAAEVAELLKDHLAHLQHPSVVGPAAGELTTPSGRLAGGKGVFRWALTAAALLLCLVAGLGFTEATSVTNLRATVIRLFTPDGTLIVQVDDPGVKVTIEGDGGLVITGAGLEEIRLRPGPYKVHADKNGKKILLDRELVSIARHGREVVKVKLEAPPVPPIGNAEKGAFVLLAAGKERKFETLAEAVQRSSAGDTIEVRGDGPFISDGVSITHRLVIRAGEGSSPSITQSPASAAGNIPLLNISAPLVLEGLELRRIGVVSKVVGEPYLLNGRGGGSLHFANCRLTFKAGTPGGVGWPFNVHVKSITLRNSLLSGNVDGTSWRYPAGGRCTIDNCVSAVGGLGFSNSDQDVRDVAICVRGSTLVGKCLTLFTFGNLELPDPAAATPPIRMEFSGNVASTTHNRGFLYFAQAFADQFSVAEAEAFLPRLVSIHEKQNVYRTGTRMLQLAVGGKRGQDRTDWDRFWNQKNTGSVEGTIRFQGGELGTRASTDPEKLTPDDFRLRPDSAGYRAGKDGKDLGADVDLVGPGPAYERWKKTPEYQQWLKDTKQAANSLDPDPKVAESVLKANAHVAAGRLDEAAEVFSTVLDLTADSSGNDAERKGIVEQIVTSDEVFPRVVKLRPKVLGLWNHRGHHLADQGRWEEAEECFRTRLRAGPDGAGTWHNYALACLAANHPGTYRQVCETMLKEFGEVADPYEAWWAGKAMMLAPHSVKDKEKALRLAERAMKGHPNPSYGASLYAAWLYRLDRLDESVACWDKVAKEDSEGNRLCFLAMAHHRLGNSDLADRFVKQARSKKADWSKQTQWYNRVNFEQLLNEMERVVSGKPD